jgi:endonuclease YncB( thermonuclease family)
MRPVRRWQPAPTPPGNARTSRRQRLPSWIVLAVVGIVAWAYSQWDKSAPVETGTGATIAGTARVTDGDSLEIGNVRVRLFGIDAPEFRQLCKDASGRDYTCGVAARETLAGLIDDRQVACTPAEGPSYDRVVAVCRVDGTGQDQRQGQGQNHASGQVDLSEAMVRAGRAIELKAHSKGRYAAAERSARDAGRGLWAGAFERPSQWRQRNGR